MWQIENVYGYEVEIPEYYFGVHCSRKRKETHEQPWLAYHQDDKRLLLNHIIGNYLKFTVVRNPYSRLLSAYLDKIRPHSELTDDKKEEVRLHYKLVQYPDSFASFVDQVCQKQDHEVNSHWQSQTYITAFDFIHYDRIGHVENLEEFYDFLQTQFSKIKDENLNKPENILRMTAAASKTVDFYTPELQQKVYQRYKNDFINFGYSESLENFMPIGAGKISGSQQELLKTFLKNTSA